MKTIYDHGILKVIVCISVYFLTCEYQKKIVKKFMKKVMITEYKIFDNGIQN